MKNHHRILTGLLAAALALTVAGCSSGTSAEEQFRQINEVNNQLTDSDNSVTTRTTISAGGESYDTITDIRIKVTGINTESMVMAMDYTIGMGDESYEMASYYTDGYMYTSTLGMLYRMPMDLESAMEQLQGNTNLLEETMDAYQNITLKKDGGNRVFTYEANPQKLNDLVNETIQSTAASTGLAADDIQMTSTEMTGTVTADKNDLILSQTAHMVYTMTLDGEEMTAEITMEATANNPGEPVVIELPDLSGAQDITASTYEEGAEADPEAETAP